MPLPKQVMKQKAEADRISKEITEGIQKQQEPQGEPQEPQGEPQEPKEPQARQEPQEPQGEPQGRSDDDFEHKYRVLQGKYNAELARRDERLSNLESVISQMEKKLTTPAKEEQPSAPKSYSYVKSEEVDEFGEDLIDIVGRRAREVVEPLLDKLIKRIQNLEGQLSGVNQRVTLSAQEQLIKDLSGAVPDWEVQNKDPEFLEWLSQEEGLSGVTRQELLRQAFEKNDTARVVRFFKGFLREHTGDDGSSSADPKSKAQVAMKTLVAPTRGRGSSNSGTPEGKRIWKTSEVTAFYADTRKGKYKSNPEEQRRIELEIVAAGRDGRIQ